MSKKLILTCTSQVQAFCESPAECVDTSEVWLANFDTGKVITGGYTLDQGRPRQRYSKPWHHLLTILADRRRRLGPAAAPLRRLALHSSALASLSVSPPDIPFELALQQQYDCASAITVADLVLSGIIETGILVSTIRVTASLTLRGCHHAFSAGFWASLRDVHATQPLTLYLEQWDETAHGFASAWIVPLAWVQRSRSLVGKSTYKTIVIRTPDDPDKCKAFESLWGTLSPDYTQHATLTICSTQCVSLAHQLKEELTCWRTGMLSNLVPRVSNDLTSSDGCPQSDGPHTPPCPVGMSMTGAKSLCAPHDPNQDSAALRSRLPEPESSLTTAEQGQPRHGKAFQLSGEEAGMASSNSKSQQPNVEDKDQPPCKCRFPWNSTGYDLQADLERPSVYHGRRLAKEGGYSLTDISADQDNDDGDDYEDGADEDDQEDEEWDREDKFKALIDDFEWEWNVQRTQRTEVAPM